METIDLFEYPELIPENINAIIDKYGEFGSYDLCNQFKKEIKTVGYTCDYGLDGIPY